MNQNWIGQCAPVEVIEDCEAEHVLERLRDQQTPVIFKGLVKHWPIVQAADDSDTALDHYLRSFDSPAPLTVYRAEPSAKGRLFYNEDFTGFNFQVANRPLSEVLDQLFDNLNNPDAPTLYVGSTLLDRFLPEFRQTNDLPLSELNPLVSLWLGNRSRIAAHYDFPENLACCVAGKRRFTLFPPEQIANLYIGPLDFTPSGQAISLVDFHQPDFERFPRFVGAMQQALVAELEPGDAIYIPSMWWHHVESLSEVNALVNYWWRSTPAYLGNPTDVLTHALMSLKSLPESQKLAWQNLLNHYVFEDGAATEHIPEHVRGMLGGQNANKSSENKNDSPVEAQSCDLSEEQANKMRAQLLRRLNR